MSILEKIFEAKTNIYRLIWSLGSRFGSTVLSFLVLYAASHALSTEEYGLYIFLFSVGSSLGLILVFGQHILLVKHYRVGGHQKGLTNQDVLLANATWLGVGCGLQLAAAFVVYVFSDSLPNPYCYLPVALLFGAIFTLSEYLQNYFRIHGQIALALAPRENIWRTLCAVSLPALAYGGYLTTGVQAAGLVTFLLALMIVYQVARFVNAEGLRFLRPDARSQNAIDWRKWNIETFYFTSNNFFISAASYLETILIGLVLSLEAAAFYFVAYRISMLLTLPVLAIDTVGVPLIAARFQNNDKTGAQYVTALLSAGSFVCALIGAIFLYFAGEFILRQFDQSFPQNFNVLLVLSLGSIIHAFFGPGTWLTMIGGGEKYILGARAVVFIFYLGLLALLGYWFGLVGIAIASITQLTVVHLIARRWAIRRWSVDNMATAIFKTLGSMRHQANGGS
ncbi:oligosaccharide flippase family protein [Labrenzia sp. CE80]|uniref:lipopolysaccharide biosynthesis protein n=1 Tax=Labrenzia sp. CE80 TaxID=1788986 RepID=UPI001930EBD4